MNTILVIFIIALGFWLLYKLFNSGGKDNYNRNASDYNRSADNYDKGEEREKSNKKAILSFLQKRKNNIGEKAKKQNIFARIFSKPLPFNDEAITWCANFLIVEKNTLVNILRNTSNHYTHFKLSKRSGGYRTISAPDATLLNIQKTIYKRILLSVNIHPASMGFRQNISVVHNAKAHLGNKQILKVDIADFFGSIKKHRIINAFAKIGYPTNISEVLAELCILQGKLPQGAATSPTLSNIIAYDMDVKLVSIAQKNSLIYTRYADDLTFSGEEISFEQVFAEINNIIRKEKFVIQRKKTRFLTEKKRKIITGISVSSGEKITIVKAKKREIRKTVYYILTKGLAEHQRFIGSTDPSYMKRLMGYLNFWLMVEPDNEYVKKSIEALKKV
ncbi:RNA-directed DNA polymerase [Dysgonomonas sp. PH5-45]|uniref:retron St85 family RNA-directed DNA polymerase n=1 Tax=unclassified Dysgonomonas TaxID=2630389 RepID=UPI0024757F21|nr:MULTISPECIES: retron St85 family RNA-directed DNA polymerase [unclassified Dysgonomonas]MDH6355819.1 RNA-directed DNA polymerase [Dysgonomonas sp. PH5-45]MDH6388714.1 RNA-directed DNA polymerase [Dysgonomonas sp. PH5-37]